MPLLKSLRLWLSSLALLISCSCVYSSETGDLFFKAGSSSFLGTSIIGASSDVNIQIKTAPYDGIVRIIGERYVILPENQFQFDLKSGLFGWFKKFIYHEFIPSTLPLVDDLNIYSIQTMSVKTGIQTALVYLYSSKVYNAEMELYCQNKIKQVKGAALCKQFEGSPFSVTFKKGFKVAIVPRETKGWISDIPYTYKSSIDGSLTLINIIDHGHKVIARGIIVSSPINKKFNLPGAERASKTYTRLGLGVSSAQCGKKRFDKDPNKSALVKCREGDSIYQWSLDGRFREGK